MIGIEKTLKPFRRWKCERDTASEIAVEALDKEFPTDEGMSAYLSFIGKEK